MEKVFAVCLIFVLALILTSVPACIAGAASGFIGYHAFGIAKPFWFWFATSFCVIFVLRIVGAALRGKS